MNEPTVACLCGAKPDCMTCEGTGTAEAAHCGSCGQLTALDLLDAKDDGTGNFTILHCRACYGPGWLPATRLALQE